jgi:hypothetical protein
MPRLVACPSCSAHVHWGTNACPHCGQAIPAGAVGRTAGAVLMGLTLAGCPGDDVGGPVPQPEYGVPATESGEPIDDTGSEASTGHEDGTGTGAETDATTSVGEPEYGVPETSSVGEPDYGVPETSGA